jgi:hypothetical protein
MVEKPSLTEVQQSFKDAYEDLSAAYWAASTVDAKDRIYAAEETVENTLDSLNAKELETRDEVFKQVAADIKPGLDRLDSLKADIDKIIHAVNVAANLVRSLGKALDLAARYFA